LLFAHEARDGGTNRADTILDGANFLLHKVSVDASGAGVYTARFECKRNR